MDSLHPSLHLHTEERPWGKFEQFTHNMASTVKIITVTPGESLSLQYHEKRTEFWRVISGNGSLTLGDKEIDARAGENHLITPTTKHRMTAGTEPLVILEISFGDFDENDIIRLEDKYGRTK